MKHAGQSRHEAINSVKTLDDTQTHLRKCMYTQVNTHTNKKKESNRKK